MSLGDTRLEGSSEGVGEGIWLQCILNMWEILKEKTTQNTPCSVGMLKKEHKGSPRRNFKAYEAAGRSSLFWQTESRTYKSIYIDRYTTYFLTARALI